jgi:ankyrin repeat protein
MNRFGEEVGVLLACSKRNSFQTFERTLHANPHLAREKRDGTSLLVETAGLGLLEPVVMLLDAGADVNFLNDEGFSALHQTLEKNTESSVQLDIARTLIQRGADVEKVGVNGWRPLHQAATYGLTKFVDLLLQHGADVNARSEAFDRETPVEIAERLGHSKIVEALTRHGGRRPLGPRQGK